MLQSGLIRHQGTVVGVFPIFGLELL